MAAMVIVAMVLSGCLQPKHPRTAGDCDFAVPLLAAGGAVMLGGMAIKIKATPCSSTGQEGCANDLGPLLVLPLAVGAAALILTAALGIEGYSDCKQRAPREAPPPPPPTEAERRQAKESEESRRRRAEQANRGRARALTDQVAEQARAGDCQSVAKTDRAVRDLDPEFHATVFVRDAAIKRCLDTTSGATEEPKVSP